MHYVVWLHEEESCGAALSGGKAASLAALTQAGFPVPRGFVCTTEAYRQQLAAHGLAERIAEALRAGTLSEPRRLAEVSTHIRGLIESSPMPQDLEATILEAYGRLNGSAVAVRSSATAEDWFSASFAGQHDSFLNVRSPDDLLAQVKACWGSLWSPRALDYRARREIDHLQVLAAVLVQELIAAEVSGTTFTLDPVTGERDKVVISSIYGLAEPLAAGMLTPDLYVLDKKSLRVLDREVARQEWMLVANPAGGVRQDVVPAERVAQPSLAPEALREVAALALRLEHHRGSAQDVEWAWREDRLFLLQSRPVTTAGGGSASPSQQIGWLDRLQFGFLLEYFPTAPFPFDLSVLAGLIDAALGLGRLAGLRPRRASEILQLQPDGRISIRGPLFRLSWWVVLCPWTLTFAVLRGLRVDPRRFQEEGILALRPEIEALARRQIDSASDADLLVTIDSALALRDHRLWAYRAEYIVGGWAAILLLRGLTWLIGSGRRQALEKLVFAQLDHPTARMTRELRRLATHAADSTAVRESLLRRSPVEAFSALSESSEGRLFLARLEEFLNEFGARTPGVLPYPSAPTFRGDPGIVLQLVRGLIADGGRAAGASPKPPAASGQPEIVSGRIADLIPWWSGLRAPISFVGQRARSMAEERDWTMFLYEKLMVPVRQAMQEVGRRLAERGAIRAPSDVRFLTVAEVRAALACDQQANAGPSLADQVNHRRRMRGATMAQWQRLLSGASPTGGNRLRGTPASGGLATGPARVVLSESDFSHLQPGEILICRTTSPVWTPLFDVAGGIVTDIGGPLSHAAIVARESGIPAVLDTRFATTRIQDGDQVVVDGNSGVVRWNSSLKEFTARAAISEGRLGAGRGHAPTELETPGERRR